MSGMQQSFTALPVADKLAIVEAQRDALLSATKEMLNHFDRSIYKSLYDKWAVAIAACEKT